MKRTWNAFFSALVVCMSFGCVGDESIINTLDRAVFSRYGTFIFSSYRPLTLKEIHLGLEELRGQKVMIEGKIYEAGKHQTYFIMEDESARMLVVLTKYPNVLPDLGSRNGKQVKVLGIVGNGKKGLPVVMASAIRTMNGHGDSDSKS